jgi:hypothetical protein
MLSSLTPKTDKQNKNKLKNFKQKVLLILFLFFLSIIVFFSFFSDNALKLYEKYFVNNHQEVVTYLQKVSMYNKVSTEILDSIRVKFNTLSEDEYDREVKTAQADLQKIISQVAALKPPEDFKQHKETFIEVLHYQLHVLSVYNKTRKSYVFNELENSMSELNQKQDTERKALLNAFKAEGIEYKQVGNGSIRFWYKGHSAMSLNRSK